MKILKAQTVVLSFLTGSSLRFSTAFVPLGKQHSVFYDGKVNRNTVTHDVLFAVPVSKRSKLDHTFESSFSFPDNNASVEPTTPEETIELYRTVLESNSEVNWELRSSTEDLVDLVSTSFCGSENAAPEPVFEFALRGIVPQDFNKNRCDLFKYVVSMMVEESFEKGSLAFGHSASSVDGSLLSSGASCGLASAVVLTACDPKVEFNKSALALFKEECQDMLKFFTDAAFGKLPMLLRDPHNLATLLSRVSPLKAQLLRCHEIYGPQEKHVYVSIVAMDPAFQGRGFGKQLMNQIIDIADTLGEDCYLECAGERNPRFYEKFGFRIANEMNFTGERGGPGETVYIMVREARK